MIFGFLKRVFKNNGRDRKGCCPDLRFRESENNSRNKRWGESGPAPKRAARGESGLNPRWGESGNVFFTLFGAVALVGVVGVATSTLMRGPVGTVVKLNAIAKADAQMQIAHRLAMLEAAKQTDSGDCDADGFVEPIPPLAAGCAPSLTGGGCLPNEIGASKNDPWGTNYGYCSWDHGDQIGVCAAGNRAGSPLTSTVNDNPSNQTVIAIISAGPDRQFQTSCVDYVDGDSDGDPDNVLVNKPTGSDDLIVDITYGGAVEASGGLWKIKSGDPGTAFIDKDIEAQGDATVAGSVDFQSGGSLSGGALGSAFDINNTALDFGADSLLLLPDQNTSGSTGASSLTYIGADTGPEMCLGAGGANEGALRVNVGATWMVLEICSDANGWTEVGGFGSTAGAQGNAGDVQFSSGGGDFAANPSFNFNNATGLLNVPSIATTGDVTVGGNMAATGDVSGDNASFGGTLDVTGASTLSSTLDVTGATDLGSTLDVTGATTLNNSLSVAGHTDVTTVTASGAAIMESTLDAQVSVANSTGSLNLNDDVIVTGTADLQNTISNTSANNGGDVRIDDSVIGDSFRLDGDGAAFDEGLYYNGGNGLELRTENLVRLTIDSSGDVGIGTQTPATLLDVDGVIKVGVDATTCLAGTVGAIRYSSNVDELELCSGDSNGDTVFDDPGWVVVGTSGGGGGGVGGLWDEYSYHIAYEDSSFIVKEGQNISFASAFLEGPGTRFLWYPSAGSFRAGTVTGSQWDDGNIGQDSVAFGLDTVASGTSSIALGQEARATAANSMAIGLGDSGLPAPVVDAANSIGIFMGDQAGTVMASGAPNQFGIFGGDVILSSGTQTSASGTLRLDVEGAVGANQYCDEFGNNCFIPQDVFEGTSPGADTEIVFNSGGVYGTDPNFVFINSTNSLGINTNTISGTLTLDVEGQAGADQYCDENGNNCFLPEDVANQSVPGADTEVLFNSGGSMGTDTGFVFISSSDRLGLGIANPQAQIDIAEQLLLGNVNDCTANTQGALRLNVAGDVLEMCDFAGAGDYIAIGGASINAPGNDREIVFNSGGLLGTHTNFVFDAAGRLGIGLANPDDDLDVVGSAQVTGATVFGSTMSVAGSISDPDSDVVIADGLNITGAVDLDTTLNVDGAAVFNSTVGIGVAVPDVRLDVNGTLKMAYGGEACDANRQGGIHYDSSDDNFYVCQDGATWQRVLTAGAGVTAPGNDREIIFNSGGSLDAATNFVYNAAGDLIVGSYQIDDTTTGTEDSRMYFDVSNSAFRAGSASGGQWDFTSAGQWSAAFGRDTVASGNWSFAAGITSQAVGQGAIAMGTSAIAGGMNGVAIGPSSNASQNSSVALGASANATGPQATAIGSGSYAIGQNSAAIGWQSYTEGDNSYAFGRFARTTGNNSVAISATGTSVFGSANYPTVGGEHSFGLFLDDQENVQITDDNTIGLFGAEVVIDPNVPASNLTADTALEIQGTLKIDYGGEACDANRQGGIHYDSSDDNFYVCQDGATWQRVITAGAGGAQLAAGNDREVQFNSGGFLSTISTFVYTSAGHMGINTNAPESDLDIAGTDAILIPRGTTPQRPGQAGTPLPPVNGMLRYNTQKNKFEGYQDGKWGDLVTNQGQSVGVFEDVSGTGAGPVRMTSGQMNWATADFVVGSPQLDDDGDANHDKRMFFDKSQSAFRAGSVTGNQWDTANIGQYSAALGSNTTASALNSFAGGSASVASGNWSFAFGSSVQATASGAVAFGNGSTATGASSFSMGSGDATGLNSLAIGNNPTASAQNAIAIGPLAQASAIGSVAIGDTTEAAGQNSTALGYYVEVQGDYSVGFGVGESSVAPTWLAPIVSGDNAFGIFMGDQNGVNFASPNTMGIFGGSVVIDRHQTATNLSADTVLEVDGTIKIAYGGEACDASREGAIRYDSAADQFAVCETAGTWAPIVTSGGGSIGAIDDLTDGATDYATDFNLFMGQNAGANTPAGAQFNVAIGQNAFDGGAKTNAADFNTALGYNTLSGNTTGAENTAIGLNALQNNTSGYNNTAIGSRALFGTTSGYNNTATGFRALYANTTGSHNISNGGYSLRSNIDGNYNVATGYQALELNANGSNNLAIGYQALRAAGADNNIAIGHKAGDVITSGSDNIMIGKDTDPPNATDSYRLNIGNTIYGDLAAGTVGVATQTPQSRFDVNGTIKIGFSGESCDASREGAIHYDSAANTFSFCADTANDWEVVSFGGGALDDLTDAVYDITTDHNMVLGSNTAPAAGAINNIFIGEGAGGSTTTSAADQNIALGYNALNALTDGVANTASGHQALLSNTTGSYNTANGTNALRSNTTGSRNTASGRDALYFNTTGGWNVATGVGALFNNTTGNYNTANGETALYSNTTGGWNVASGMGALYSNKAKSRNTALGFQAMYYADDTTTAGSAYNTAVGYQALFGSTTAANNTGGQNTALGAVALYSNTTGFNNTASGYRALYFNSAGYENTATGARTLESNTTGFRNAATGAHALRNNTTGYENTATGTNALYSNTAGNYNTATGESALWANTTGPYNTASGNAALELNTTGGYNTASGATALRNNTTGYGNTATGYRALFNNTTGYENTATAGYVLEDNTTGFRNTVIGYQALRNNTTGNYNIMLGLGAGYNGGTNASTTGSGNILIGNNVTAGAGGATSNYINIGNVYYGSANTGFARTAGTLQIAYSGEACDAAREGSIHYDSSQDKFFGCNTAGSWTELGSGGGGGGGDGYWAVGTGGIHYTSAGAPNVGIGTSSPATRLDTVGTIKIGYGGESCDAAREGAIHYDSAQDKFFGCNTAGSWTEIGAGAGGGDFVSLTDTPGSLVANKWVKVNAGGTALEFTNAPLDLWSDSGSGYIEYSSVLGGIKVSGTTGAALPPTGAIGSGGGGGGGASNLPDLGDVSISSPSNGQVLLYSAGAWINATGGGGGGTPGGSDTQIQFNNAGSFDGSAGLTWSGTVLGVTGDVQLSSALKLGIHTGIGAPLNVPVGDNLGDHTATQDLNLNGFDLTGAVDIIYSGMLNDISDMRLKTDIKPLDSESVVGKLTAIETYSFRMKNDASGRIEFGVMAQEVEKIFPELVATANDAMGTKSVNYTGFIAPLIEASKELKAENEALKAELAELKTAQADILKEVKGLKAHTGYGIDKAEMSLWILATIFGTGGMFFLVGGIIRNRQRKTS